MGAKALLSFYAHKYLTSFQITPVDNQFHQLTKCRTEKNHFACASEAHYHYGTSVKI